MRLGAQGKSLNELRIAGCRRREEGAAASFDGSAEAEYSWPPLTTVEQPVVEMAEAAVAALVGAGRGEKPRHRIFPTRLHIRQSCGCP
jgi:LacI family transcriptional regulator